MAAKKVSRDKEKGRKAQSRTDPAELDDDALEAALGHVGVQPLTVDDFARLGARFDPAEVSLKWRRQAAGGGQFGTRKPTDYLEGGDPSGPTLKPGRPAATCGNVVYFLGGGKIRVRGLTCDDLPAAAVLRAIETAREHAKARARLICAPQPQCNAARLRTEWVRWICTPTDDGVELAVLVQLRVRCRILV